MILCDKCGAKIPDNAKFCAQCGDVVDEQDKQITSLETGTKEVKVVFGYSSSVNYEKAINIVKNIPSYQEIGDGKEKTHIIKVPTTEVELLLNIYDLVGSWKSSKMTVDGKTITKKNLVYGAMGCYKNWIEVQDKIKYCYGSRDWERNIWGCQKIGLPLYLYGGGWLSYGKFDNKGVWFFDKERIYREIEEKINELSMCPILNKERIYRTIKLIPDSINPKLDANWEYDIKHIEEDGTYKTVAIGVKPTIEEAYYLIDEKEKPKWDINEEENIQSYQAMQGETSTNNNSEHPLVSESKKVLWLGITVFIILWMIFRK